MRFLNPIKFLVKRLGAAYVTTLCKREFEWQRFVGTNERPVEFAFVFRQLVEIWPKTILDVGTGQTALPHLMRNCGFVVSATDNIKDYWPAGMTNRHYHVINDDITKTKLTETYDLITCISVLEHIKNHTAAIESMYKLLNPGGHLILTCPYNEVKYIPNVYELPESYVTEDYPFVTQAFSRHQIDAWLSDVPFRLVKQEFWQFFEGDYWTCGARLPRPVQVGKEERHQISCMVFQKTA